MTTLREKLIKIGAKVGRPALYIAFLMDEVAISRNYSDNVLLMIDRLQPSPVSF